MNLFRPQNLLIVALTQYLLQYLVLVPALAEAELEPLLGYWHFFLLVFTTILIAAGGYIINDLIDFETDLVNRPERMAIGKKWSKKTAIVIYVLLSLVGLEIAWYLAGQVGNRMLVLIYPAAVLLLFLYSRKLKGMPLAGNIVVSIFCAGVAGVVLFAERDSFSQITDNQPLIGEKIKWLFGGYIIFAFITTLLREIVKDIEDMDGDRKSGLRTLPIVFGLPSAKRVALGVAFALLLCSGIFLFWMVENQHWAGLGFLLLAIVGPSIFLVKLLLQAKSKKHFSRLSKFIKFTMLAGLILLIFLVAN